MPERDDLWRLTVGAEGEDDYESYEFSRSGWMLSEAREVKKWIDLNPPAMWVSISQDDPQAWTALLCILRRRNGQPDLRFADVDANYGSMTLVPIEDEEDGEPDPTPAAS